jgi:type II secretory pathway pseudopilin PulG
VTPAPRSPGTERRVERTPRIEEPPRRRWPLFVVIALFALAGFGTWKKQQAARVEAERAAAEAVALRNAEEARRQEARELRYANPPSVPDSPAAAASAPAAPAPAASAAAAPAEKPAERSVEKPAERSVEKPADARFGDKVERFGQEAEREFRAADTNGDGYLSPAEARRFPALERNFQRVDKDGDGRISLQEFAQAKRAMLERKFAKP